MFDKKKSKGNENSLGPIGVNECRRVVPYYFLTFVSHFISSTSKFFFRFTGEERRSLSFIEILF